MDTNLNDDTLKLVRSKILFVKREYETAFQEREDLVPDNMSGSAFTAWKIAEFMQNIHTYDTPHKWRDRNYPGQDYFDKGRLTSLPEEDKKYLRVYYEVLDRYPREKFKYEEDQIRVLQQIRDKLAARAKPPAPPSPGPTPAPAPKPPDPFDDIRDRLQLSKEVFDRWRADFARCADKMAPMMADILNRYRSFTTKSGTTNMLNPPEVKAEEIAAALKSSRKSFNRATLDRFTGATIGDLRVYTAPDSPPEERPAPPPTYSIWGPAREGPPGEWRQRITGNPMRQIDPDDVPTISTLLGQEIIDLTFNAYAEDLGIVSWVIFFTNHKSQMRSIGYEMNGKLLWINQLLTPDVRPLQGEVELPSIGHSTFIPENQFIVSVDYLDESSGQPLFNVYAMHMNFDFKKCTVTMAGPILEMKNRLGAGKA